MTEENISPQLEKYLEALKESAPERDARSAAQGRAAFLAQADQRQTTDHPGLLTRIRNGFHSFPSQATPRLTAATASLLITLFLTLGLVGGTVYAAQDSLPDQALYAVKTLTEDVRLRYVTQPGQKMRLLEALSKRRVKELSVLSEQDKEIHANTLTRLEQHTDAMLNLSASLEESEIPQALLRVRNTLQRQEKTIGKLARTESGSASKALSRMQENLQAKRTLVERGMVDTASFREYMNSSNPLQLKPTATKGKPEREKTPEAKGKPQEAGPPQGKGEQQEGDQPDEKGKPKDAAPPDDRRKPEETGPSEGKGKPDEITHPQDKRKPHDSGPPPGKEKP